MLDVPQSLRIELLPRTNELHGALKVEVRRNRTNMGLFLVENGLHGDVISGMDIPMLIPKPEHVVYCGYHCVPFWAGTMYLPYVDMVLIDRSWGTNITYYRLFSQQPNWTVDVHGSLETSREAHE